MSFFRIINFKLLSVCIFVLSLVGCSSGGGATGGVIFGNLNLSWDAPDKREDGFTEFFPSVDLAEYRVYYGSEPGDYQNQVDVDGFTDVSVASIPTGRYYAVVTAVDTEGRESLYSAEVEVLVTEL